MGTLGWFKTPVSSQTEKLMAGTKFSDYLGLKHYKNAKKLKHFNHLGLAQRPQSFSLYQRDSIHTFLVGSLNSLLFYNALDLSNQKILCLPSIFQFDRKLGF